MIPNLLWIIEILGLKKSLANEAQYLLFAGLGRKERESECECKLGKNSENDRSK